MHFTSSFDDPHKLEALANEKGVPTWSDATPEGRWRAYDYEDMVNRDKASLDSF